MSIVIVQANHDPLSYCQRPDWYSGSESAYSLFSKFCYLNRLRTIDLVDIAVSRESRMRSKQKKNPNGNLADARMFDLSEIARVTGLPIGQIKQAFVFHSGVETRRPWETAAHLRVCSLCLESGYHSTIFQLNHIPYCPIHSKPLLDHCPHCKRQIPYQLSRAMFEKPYHCPCCRHPWALFAWRKNSRPRLLTSKQREALLELNETTELYRNIIESSYNVSQHYLINELGTVCLPEAFQIERKLEYLRFLELLAQSWQREGRERVPEDRILQHYRCGISCRGSRPDKYGRLQARFSGVGRSWDTDQPYQYALTVYKAIRRYLWRKIVKTHRACIRQVTRSLWCSTDALKTIPICPMSYAFIIWRMYWEWRNIPQSLFWKNRQCYFGLAVWLSEGAPFIPKTWGYRQGQWLNDHIFAEDCLSSFYELLNMARESERLGEPLRWSKLGLPRRYQPYWVATASEQDSSEIAIDTYKVKQIHHPELTVLPESAAHLHGLQTHLRGAEL